MIFWQDLAEIANIFFLLDLTKILQDFSKKSKVDGLDWLY